MSRGIAQNAVTFNRPPRTLPPRTNAGQTNARRDVPLVDQRSAGSDDELKDLAERVHKWTVRTETVRTLTNLWIKLFAVGQNARS